jgi:hypothetical protein
MNYIKPYANTPVEDGSADFYTLSSHGRSDKFGLVWACARACGPALAEDLLLQASRCLYHPRTHTPALHLDNEQLAVQTTCLDQAYTRPDLVHRRQQRGEYMDLLCDDDLMMIFFSL